MKKKFLRGSKIRNLVNGGVWILNGMAQGEKRSNVSAGLRFDFSVLSRDVTKALQLDEKPGPEYSGAIWEN